MNICPKEFCLGKVGLILLLSSVGALAEGAGFSGETANPYSVIIERNVFRLAPVPIVPGPDKAPAPKNSTVYLTGIMQTGWQWKALLTIKPAVPNLRGQNAPSYVTLSEGEKTTSLELVKVYPQEGRIDLLNEGRPETLSMITNAAELQTTARRPTAPPRTVHVWHPASDSNDSGA